LNCSLAFDPFVLLHALLLSSRPSCIVALCCFSGPNPVALLC
jgi:hypothetical protein